MSGIIFAGTCSIFNGRYPEKRSLSFVNKILILIGKPLKMDFRGIYDNVDM